MNACEKLARGSLNQEPSFVSIDFADKAWKIVLDHDLVEDDKVDMDGLAEKLRGKVIGVEMFEQFIRNELI